MSFAVAGDILLGDQPLTMGFGIGSRFRGHYGPAFAAVAEELGRHDFVAANFDGVLMDPRAAPAGAGVCMTAPPTAVHALRAANITYLSVANNHSMEYGSGPFRAMLRMFDDGGITTFGQLTRPYVVVSTAPGKVGLLGCSMVPAFYGITPEYVFLDAGDAGSLRAVVDLVSEAKRQCDYLVVMPHWGSEFMTAPSPAQIDVAARLVAAGVDLIVGAHPHVIQDSYRIKGSFVFFSVGNLLSDYWQERIRENLVVEVDLADSWGVRVHRFSTDRHLCIRRVAPPTSAASVVSESPPPPTIDESRYRAQVLAARARVRRESAWFLLRNAHRVVRHPKLLSWACRRAWYLAAHRADLRRDPSRVYSGPMH